MKEEKKEKRQMLVAITGKRRYLQTGHIADY